MNTARMVVPANHAAQKGLQVIRPPRNTQELRTFLLEMMIKVANGQQDTGDAKAICNYAQQVYNTVNMELRHAISSKALGSAEVAPVSFVAQEKA